MCNCDKPRSVIAALNTDERYESAIAERNMSWAAFKSAQVYLDDAVYAASLGLLREDQVRPIRQRRNTALDNLEHAERELVRVRVWRQRP